MTEANCGSIKKERLDWDFLQALVKMNTAVDPTLPVILPFSSVCRRAGQDRAGAGAGERTQNKFGLFYLI